MDLEHFDALAYLSERWTEQRPLSRFATLLEALGEPYRGMCVVHVAGTNGKGSTCAYVERMLRRQGFRTGLFTSPALERVNERFQIGGELVDDETLERATRQVAETEQALGFHFGGFDRMTAVGLLLFAQAGVDWLVLETGLGGRIDATTAVPADISMLTRIDHDHMELLGDSLEAIAREKAAIIQPGQRCAIVHPQEPEVMRIIEGRCAETGVPLIHVDSCGIRLTEVSDGRQHFFVQCGETHYALETKLLGRHQIENAAAALLAGRAIGLDTIAIREGISQAAWPGRFECLAGDPEVWLDGAHNPQCVRTLLDSLGEYAHGTRFVLVTSIMADKDWKHMAEMIAPRVESVVTLDLGPRSVPAETLAATFEQLGTPAQIAEDLPASFTLARAMCEDSERDDYAVLVCGSLYLVGGMRAYLLRDSD